MTYPADIVRDVANDPALARRFPLVASLASDCTVSAHTAEFDRWICSPEAKKLRSVARFSHYFATMRAVINETLVCFDAVNDGAGNEFWSRATGRYELLHLSTILYLVDSWEVPGAVLECGAYTGFSSTVLSWACDLLNRDLHIADSFEGIPDLGQGEDMTFAPGSYACGIETVRANLETMGRPRVASYIKGWFNQSLPDFHEPIAMLWMDVDLRESVVDVMDAVTDQLQPGAAICCHEFLPDRIDNGRIVGDHYSPAGLRESLLARDIAHNATHVSAYTAIVERTEDDARPRYVPAFTERVLALTTPRERAKSFVRAMASATDVFERDTVVGKRVRNWLHHHSPNAFRDLDISPRIWR
ncbi:MAG: hypothetical protein ACI81R_000368 [Bradymonadia bacterium]|jgi:hypothetical protein